MIVTGSIEDVDREVTEALNDRWELSGGISMAYDDDQPANLIYAQAMTFTNRGVI